MFLLSRIRNQYGGDICRHCINTKYGAELHRSDCLYDLDLYNYSCPCCGERRHIVRGLRFSGWLKTLFK